MATNAVLETIASREHKEQAKRLRAEGVSVTAGRVARSALIELEEL